MDHDFGTAVIEGTEVSRIAVEGELDLTTVELLEPSADAAIAAARPVLVDLSKCPFLDSTGLRLILIIHEGLADATELGTPMAIVARSPGVRRLFSVTSIDRRIPVVATEEEAATALGEAGR